MDIEIAGRWIDALLSGEFKQGSEQLRPSESTYCCLGVLTELYLRDHGKSWDDEATSTSYCRKRPYKDHSTLTDNVRLWSGMHTADGFIDSRTWLGKLNDDGTPFHKIAEIIRVRAEEF